MKKATNSKNKGKISELLPIMQEHPGKSKGKDIRYYLRIRQNLLGAEVGAAGGWSGHPGSSTN